ncbi:MAG: caspase family protein [Opitutales bacterium]|nr:caspase family protein [Opitutales bacterium]
MKKRAVIVRINRYEDSDHIRALRCAEQDARGLDKFLEHRLGFENLTLLGSEATSREVNEAVRESCAGLGKGDHRYDSGGEPVPLQRFLRGLADTHYRRLPRSCGRGPLR